MAITPKELIALFQEALDEKYGYIWGKTHEKWSEQKQAEYARTYAGDANRQQSIQYGGQWAGHWVTDCSGLFKWAFNTLGGDMYHGSNTMYNSWCTAKGQLKSGKRSDGQTLKPGTAVFTGKEGSHGHVGLYIGDGKVIEAQGSKAGVVTSKVGASKWTFWGELKGVDYGSAAEGTGQPAAVSVPAGKAVVTGKRVALREGPSTDCGVIRRLDEGETVELAKEPADWTRVSYRGSTGYMMTKYLKKG